MIPRSLFYPGTPEDTPIPIGPNQTAPTQAAAYFLADLVRSVDKVLEIGTGSGYQACVLAERCGEVYTIELASKPDPLIQDPRWVDKHEELHRVNDRIYLFRGDGKNSWPYPCIFDAVLVACAAKDICHSWVDQLREGGHLIVPRGTLEIEVWEKRWGKLRLKRVAGYAPFTSLE